MHFEFGTDPARGNDAWRAWSTPLTRRQKAYLAIWRALRPLGDGSDKELWPNSGPVFRTAIPDARPRPADDPRGGRGYL